MPTTLVGLVIFVVLLLPGFAYLVGKERAGTERRASPFRETVAVVSASVVTELTVVIASWPWWSRVLDVDKLVGSPSDYWKERPGLLASWGICLLLAATLLGHMFTWPRLRSPRWLGRLAENARDRAVLKQILDRVRDYPHPSSVSGWWMLFETWKLDRALYAACVMDNGSYITGWVRSFNTSADDTTDRDLILGEPIRYRAPGHEDVADLECDAVCVSAKHIVSLEVSYVNPTETAQAASVEGKADVAPSVPAEPTRSASDRASRSDRTAADPHAPVQRHGVARTSSPDHPGSP